MKTLAATITAGIGGYTIYRKPRSLVGYFLAALGAMVYLSPDDDKTSDGTSYLSPAEGEAIVEVFGPGYYVVRIHTQQGMTDIPWDANQTGDVAVFTERLLAEIEGYPQVTIVGSQYLSESVQAKLLSSIQNVAWN